MTANSPYDKLTVVEAIDSDDEDRVRVYGSIKDSAPLQGAKLRDVSVDKDEEESTEIPLQDFQVKIDCHRCYKLKV